MWECPKSSNEWQFHPQAAHPIGTYNSLNTDTSYDPGENETNRKVQLGHMFVDDNSHSHSIAGVTDQLANCEAGPRVHMLEGGGNVDNVGHWLTAQPDWTRGPAVLPKKMETAVRVPKDKRTWQSGSRCCFGSVPGRKMLDPVGPNWIVGFLSGCVKLSAHWCGNCWQRDWPCLRQCFAAGQMALAPEGQCCWLNGSLMLLRILPVWP